MICQLTRSQVLKLGYLTILLTAVGYVIACLATAAQYEGENDDETSRFKFIAIWTAIMVITSSIFMVYTLFFQAGHTNSIVAEVFSCHEPAKIGSLSSLNSFLFHRHT